MKLLVAAGISAAVTNALAIKNTCLTKHAQVGILASGNGINFDQSFTIAQSLDTESYPTNANVCVTIENGSLLLNLFTLTMNTADGLNPATMPNTGPSVTKDTFTCLDVALSTTTSQVSGALIYYNTAQVTQVSLFYGSETFGFGSKGDNDSQEFIQFDSGDYGSFIGFHGLANEDHIESLGVITQDKACSAITDPVVPVNPVDPGTGGGTGTGTGTDNGGGNITPTQPEAEPFITDDDDDSDDTFYIVLAVCAGVIFILAVVALIVCCCKKSTQRSTSKVEMINDPRQESEAELKDGQTTVGVGMVNASGNGTLPIVESDEEHVANVNVRTNRIGQGADSEKPGQERGNTNQRKDPSNDVTQ